MLDFVNTNLFKKSEVIKVAVYSNNRERAKKYAKRLADGENVISSHDYHRGLEILVEKDGLKICIVTLPFSEAIRGFRTTYAIVDSSIFNVMYGREIFHNIIRPSNIVYSSMLNDSNSYPVSTIMVF